MFRLILPEANYVDDILLDDLFYHSSIFPGLQSYGEGNEGRKDNLSHTPLLVRLDNVHVVSACG